MPELVNTRMLPVSRERVFAAFTDIDQLVRWWGPDGFTSTSEDFDFRAGGSWTMVMQRVGHLLECLAPPIALDLLHEAPQRLGDQLQVRRRPQPLATEIDHFRRHAALVFAVLVEVPDRHDIQSRGTHHVARGVIRRST